MCVCFVVCECVCLAREKIERREIKKGEIKRGIGRKRWMSLLLPWVRGRKKLKVGKVLGF